MTPDDDAEWQGFLTWNDRVVRTVERGEERLALDEGDDDADGRPHSRTEESLSDEAREAQRRAQERAAEVRREARRRLGLPEEDPR